MRIIKNELYKIFVSKTTWITIGTLFVLTLGLALMLLTAESNVKSVDNWKDGLQAENEKLAEQQADFSPETLIYQANKETIAINTYRIEHNLEPNTNFNVWSMLKESTPLTTIIALIVLVFAANSIALEHTKGTIKFIITGPIKRWKFLAAKYLTINIYALILLVAFLLFSSLIGLTVFGVSGNDFYLLYQEGQVDKVSMASYLLLNYGSIYINIVIFATFAFMLSVLIRSSVWATGISLLIYLTSGIITSFLSSKYEWTKYVLTANVDLNQYLEGYPAVKSMTLGFSITIILVYLAIFFITSFTLFNKRDIETS